MDAMYSPSASDFPADLISAVAVSAVRDADHVGLFLRELGLSAAPDQPCRLPTRFLLHVGAALRLLIWEAQGFFFHQAAGLPEARQALREAFQTLRDPDADSSAFCLQVLRLAVERFAWNGPRDLHAEIVLDDLDDEAALDLLAEFLWASRHRATPKEDC
jgi:hypothetical protein